jgi:hypothetical protein
MNPRDLLFNPFIIALGILCVAATIFVPLIISDNHRKQREANDHDQVCAANNKSSAYFTEKHGKSSISHFFCYDKDGRVYFYGDE